MGHFLIIVLRKLAQQRGDPKTVVDKMPQGIKKRKRKKTLRAPSTTEGDQKRGTREEGGREGVQARKRNEEGRRVKGADVGRSYRDKIHPLSF